LGHLLSTQNSQAEIHDLPFFYYIIESGSCQYKSDKSSCILPEFIYNSFKLSHFSKSWHPLEGGPKIKKNIFPVLLLALSLILPGQGVCETNEEKSLEAVEFLAGYSWGELCQQEDYGSLPFIMDFDFDLKPLMRKMNFNPSFLMQFQIEPYLAPITSPSANIELGVAFLLKFGLLPSTSKIQPYIKFGAGVSYMSLHTREQSTQFNFIEPGALGVHYFFKKNTALTLEGRRRHLSNCSIKEPNGGIDTYSILLGYVHRF